MINSNRFNWKGNKLYLGDKNTKYEIRPCEVENAPTAFYKIKFPDGVVSEDFYNLTWAKTNCIRGAALEYNTGDLALESPVGAFK